MRYLLLAWLLAASGWVHAQNTITLYEYWFDQNDVDRTSVAVPFPAQTIDLINQSPDVSALPVGPHRIHYRLRDANGNWSSVLSKHFVRMPGSPYHIVGFEYWFDENDADNQRTYLTVPSPANSVDVIENIDVATVPVGAHRIHYRLKDSHGFWSSVLRRDFRRNHDGPHELVLLRYWSDPDATSPDDMTEVLISPGVQYLDLMDDILFCEWSATGNTNVYFQLKDNHTQWSSVVSKSINVDLVSGAPDQPGIIDGLFNPPFNTEQTYTIDSVPGAGAYEWILPDGWSGTSTDTIITVQVGNFNDGSPLCVRAINGCGESEQTCLDISTDVANLSTSGGIGLYPNPNSGQFFLELTSTAQVAVFDASGRQIIAEQLLQGTRHTIDLGDAPGGVYSVRIIQDGRVEVRRFIVQH